MKKITVLLMLIAVLAAPLMAAEDGPIGIITAMSNELSLLLENADVTETRTIGGVDYNIGTLEGQDVVLVKAGIGKIMAAAGAATLINEFDVSSIIFTGIAGGPQILLYMIMATSRTMDLNGMLSQVQMRMEGFLQILSSQLLLIILL